MKPFYTLNPGELNLEILHKLISNKQKCQLATNAHDKILRSQKTIVKILDAEKTVYGINTGFGSLANTRISTDNLKKLQKNLVLSHACGTGGLLDDETVAIILLLKINSLALGYSGVSVQLVENLLALYNHEVYPCIPAKGSVGASGDLAPLAHMSMVLLGEGEVRVKGKILTAMEGLKLANIKAIELGPKEGLALLNGLQVSTAICIKALWKTETLFQTAIIAGSMSVDAAKGSDSPFDLRIHKARGHKSQVDVALMYRECLNGSEIRASHVDCERVQDPYSLRCQPQIMGAVLQQIRNTYAQLDVEVNAVSDNPLVFADTDEILSGGNFHGEMIAMAADNLALAIAEMGANSERRIALLIDKNLSGLPAFLVKEGGLNSGFMIAHVTAAAAASDNKALSHPHCVDSLPTSANQEDIVSMATNGALRLHTMLDNTSTILAIELLASTQGLEFHKPLKTSKKLQEIYQKVRKFVDSFDEDRYFAPDIAVIKTYVMKGFFI